MAPFDADGVTRFLQVRLLRGSKFFQKGDRGSIRGRLSDFQRRLSTDTLGVDFRAIGNQEFDHVIQPGFSSAVQRGIASAVGLMDDVPSVAELVRRLSKEYDDAKARLGIAR